MNRALSLAVCFCLVGGFSLAQNATAQFPVGTIVPKVSCSASPEQTYALYLPSNYSPAKKLPIIYVFDPGARGQLAVETIRAAAEKFGYILAGSNNSRNGSVAKSMEAAKAVWVDTQQRFPLDERRRYLAGMSGGARFATGVALTCQDCIAGVIVNAAGFPPAPFPQSIKFAFFGSVGDEDFNYAEFVDLRKKLDKIQARYRIRTFAGPHGWAPPETWLEALNWMDMQAMLAGTLPRDEQRIQKTIHDEFEQAQALESKNDPLAASRLLQSITRDFASMDDVSAAANHLAELQKSKALKAAEKEEASAIEQQFRLSAELSAKMQMIKTGDLDLAGQANLRQNLESLKKDSSNKNDPKTLVMRRAYADLIAQANESGSQCMELKDFHAAVLYYGLIPDDSRYSGWSHYQRARAYAMMSDQKKVFAELKLAATAGYHEVASLEASEFQVYREKPEFQAVLAEWKQKSQP